MEQTTSWSERGSRMPGGAWNCPVTMATTRLSLAWSGSGRAPPSGQRLQMTDCFLSGDQDQSVTLIRWLVCWFESQKLPEDAAGVSSHRGQRWHRLCVIGVCEV